MKGSIATSTISLLQPLVSSDTERLTVFLHDIEPRARRRQYRAASNYLRQVYLGTMAMGYSSSESQKADNLLEAIHHLCEAQDYDCCLETLRSFVDEKINLSLYMHLLYRGKAKQLLDLTEYLLDRFKDVDDNKHFLNVLRAKALESLGNRIEAIQIYNEICEAQPEESLEFIEAFSRLAGCQVQIGKYDIGIPRIEKALGILEKLNLERVDFKADLVENMAFYRMTSGNFDEAFELFGEVFTLRQQGNLVTALVNPLGHQGIILRKKAVSQKYLARILIVNILRFFGLQYLANLLFNRLCGPLIAELNANYAKAEELFQQAAQLSREIGDENINSWVLHHLAWVLINKGQAIAAEEYALHALKTYDEIEDQRGISDCHEQLGRIYLAMDCTNIERAEHHFSKSLDIRNTIQNFHGAASSTLNFAFLHWHRKNYFKSLKFLVKGVNKYRQIGLLNLKRIFAITVLFSVWTVGKRDWTL
jgi:tetratricopeptide (TPR) repeat protein